MEITNKYIYSMKHAKMWKNEVLAFAALNYSATTSNNMY